MLPGEIQMQGETANNPSPIEEKPGQQQGSTEEIWLSLFSSNIKLIYINSWIKVNYQKNEW